MKNPWQNPVNPLSGAEAPQQILAVRRVVQVAGVGLWLRRLLGRAPGAGSHSHGGGHGTGRNSQLDVEHVGKHGKTHGKPRENQKFSISLVGLGPGQE